MTRKYKSWLIILIVGIIIIFGLFCRARSGFQNPTDKDIYSVEGVDNSNIKPPANRATLLKQTRSLPMDSGQCPSNKPLDVCNNYNACCELSGTGSNNCLCNNPVINSCQSVYKDCLADKYLSEKSMDFISQENKNITCRKLLNNCCKITGNLTAGTESGGDMNRVTMSKAAPDSNLLCEIQGSEAEVLGLCKYTCDLNDKCSGIIYNKITGICELYDKSLVDKAPAYRNKTDEETIQFSKAGGKEGFVIGTAQDYCLSSSGETDSCWNNNTVIRDCMVQRDKCLAEPIAGLSKPKQEKHCRQIYGACCSILDGMDIVGGRFKFLDAAAGYPNHKNLLCESGGKSLDECKRTCLINPDCNYIYSNQGETSGNNKAFCKLYKGAPLAGGIVPPTFGKIADGIDSKYIYKKIEVDPDEPAEETPTTSALVPAITKTDPDDASK